MYRTSIFNPPDKLSELRREEEEYEQLQKERLEKEEKNEKVINNK
jgi:hypothetical protein